MMHGTGSSPQFQYADIPGADRCKLCGQLVGSSYYRVNGNMACAACAEKARFEQPRDSSAAYMRALTFGIGGAIAGLIIYATVGIVTGLKIGYVSLAVGYIVGKAIKAGSKGLGCRKYQLTAVLLTYAAVSLAAIPIGISQYMKDYKAPSTMQVGQQPPASDVTVGDEQTLRPKKTALQVLGSLLLLGLLSPLLELQDPFHGLIGLVILMVGLRIAWRVTTGTTSSIDGPFKNRAPA